MVRLFSFDPFSKFYEKNNFTFTQLFQKSNKIQYAHVFVLFSIDRICKSSSCLLPFSFISVHLIITHPYPPNHLFTLYVTIFLLPTFQLGANESKYPHRFTTQIKFCKRTLFLGPSTQLCLARTNSLFSLLSILFNLVLYLLSPFLDCVNLFSDLTSFN